MTVISRVYPADQLKARVEQLLHYSFWTAVDTDDIQFWGPRCVAVEVHIKYWAERHLPAGGDIRDNVVSDFSFAWGIHPEAKGDVSRFKSLLAEANSDAGNARQTDGPIFAEVKVHGLQGDQNHRFGQMVIATTFLLLDRGSH